MSCRHSDIRKFDDIRCCLACGEAVFENAHSIRRSSVPDSQYQYRTLNYTLGQEIRLIKLLPGQSSEPLHCDIVHVNLDDDPSFEAVSYTWATDTGDACLSKTIKISDGTSVNITTNCEAILRLLRKPGLSRRLWIDAICINQAKTEERNHQVGLMSQIYARAHKVTICIEDSGYFAHEINLRGLFAWLRDPDSGKYRLGHKSVQEGLVRLRYFTRAWIIQEVALAKALSLRINDEEVPLLPYVLQRIRRSCENSGVLSWDFARGSEADIITCLLAGMECECSDPRDRVYAVLSLMAPMARSLIPVDYSASVAAVYASAAIAVCQIYQNLDILRSISSKKTTSGVWLSSFLKDYAQLANYSLSRLRTTESCSWQPKILVQSVPMLANVSLVQGGKCLPSAIFQNPLSAPMTGKLPRLQVRAHILDRITPMASYLPCGYPPTPKSSHLKCSPPRSSRNAYGYPHVNQDRYLAILARFKPAPKYSRSLDEAAYDLVFPILDSFFTMSSQARVKGDDEYPEYAQGKAECLEVTQEIAEYLEDALNMTDFENFQRDVAKEWKKHDDGSSTRSKGVRQSPEIFYTFYSIGFCNVPFTSGDAVFAIDGVSTPMILRQIGPREYKVVGECYLWAALELDYWNPGTRKGMWDTRPYDHGCEQTQMIEIV